MYSGPRLADTDDKKQARLQTLFTVLLRHRLEESLGDALAGLERWKGGGLGPFEAHAEVVKHVARAERLAGAIARAETAGPGPVLLEALDAGLLDAAEFRDLVGVPPGEVARAPELEEPPESHLPPKRQLIDQLLGDGAVLVHLDARSEGVSVPAHLTDDPRLVLRFGYGLAPSIVDLEVDDEGISGTLTFAGVPRHCVVPWSALYAVVAEASQEAMVWPDDVPPEVLEAMNRLPDEAPVEKPPQPKPGVPHLKLVE